MIYADVEGDKAGCVDAKLYTFEWEWLMLVIDFEYNVNLFSLLWPLADRYTDFWNRVQGPENLGDMGIIYDVARGSQTFNPVPA